MAIARLHRRRIAVYIGRFQPFHRGHEYVLQRCLTHYDETIVMIGSAFKARDIENPFSYNERRQIIYNWVATTSPNRINNEVHVRALRDRPYNDAEWIKSVQEHVVSISGRDDCEVTIVGCDRDASTWYLKSFPQWKRDIIEPYRNIPGLAATQLRKAYFDPKLADSLLGIDGAGLVPATADFLSDFRNTEHYKGLVGQTEFIRTYREKWGTGPFVTADICVVQSGHVLVIERGPEEYGAHNLALPGGFVKPHQRIKDAAVDECMEETGICLTTGKQAEEITRQILMGSIRAWEQFDHPKRSLLGRIVTTCYLVRLDDTKPLPAVSGQLVPLGEEGGGIRVETTNAKWMTFEKALDNPSLWHEDHHAMAETMISLIRD